MNPFDWSGPEFLALYVAVLIGAIGIAIGLRWLLRLPACEPPAEALELSPYLLAYLAGGARRAIDTVIVRLMRSRSLALDADTGKLCQQGDSPSPKANKLKRVVYAAAGPKPGKHINDIHAAAAAVADQMREPLKSFGLVLTAGEAVTLRLTSAAVIILAGLFGLAKVIIGVARDRPVGFLRGLLVLTLIVAVVFVIKRPFRSRRGDTLLRRLRHDNAALQYAAGRSVNRLADTDLVLALGLFGLSVLAAGPLRNAYTSLLAARL
jgi:uncharacterized protein (TIGR04222 family)